VPTNDDRQKETAVPYKPSNPKRRRLDVAVIVTLSVVTLMVIALLANLFTALRP
jgi:hypothetical protein